MRFSFVSGCMAAFFGLRFGLGEDALKLDSVDYFRPFVLY